MQDEDKTKEQLNEEIAKLRQRIAELERFEVKRKEVEEALRESEEMYRTLLKTSPDAIAILDLETKFIEVSQRWMEMWGYESAEEVIGRSSFEFIAPESHVETRINIQKFMQEGFIKNVIITCLRKDGTRFIAEVYGALIRDASGEVKAIMAITRDITKRKQAEIALRESEETYRKLVKTSPDIVAVSDLNGIIIELSQRAVEHFGFKSARDVIGKSGLDLVAPEDRQKVIINMQKGIKEDFVENVELISIKTNGTRFIVETNSAVIKDAYGNPKAFISTSRDITKRKKMEEKLKRYSEELKMMVKERTRELKKSQEEVKTLRRHIQQSRRYPEIVGNSSKILRVIDLVHQVAYTNSTVLIYGETGSGKDLIAKAIHYNSTRKERPFLVLNCATLPEQLIESELFGYVKGAFTGASNDKKGLFEAADKGTIFLNEIGEMPLNVQAKLLQVLENQEIRRIGETKNITIDVRIIAASNRDLEEATKNRQFREDLFYRLNVFPIRIPPLQERKEDIPLLVKHFFNKYCATMNIHIQEISKEAMNLLCKYSYPGNVRELENIIQRSIIIGQGSTLLPEHLPDKLKYIMSLGVHERLAE